MGGKGHCDLLGICMSIKTHHLLQLSLASSLLSTWLKLQRSILINTETVPVSNNFLVESNDKDKMLNDLPSQTLFYGSPNEFIMLLFGRQCKNSKPDMARNKGSYHNKSIV